MTDDEWAKFERTMKRFHRNLGRYPWIIGGVAGAIVGAQVIPALSLSWSVRLMLIADWLIIASFASLAISTLRHWRAERADRPKLFRVIRDHQKVREGMEPLMDALRSAQKAGTGVVIAPWGVGGFVIEVEQGLQTFRQEPGKLN